jgi:hypothetical protein
LAKIEGRVDWPFSISSRHGRLFGSKSIELVVTVWEKIIGREVQNFGIIGGISAHRDV